MRAFIITLSLLSCALVACGEDASGPEVADEGGNNGANNDAPDDDANNDANNGANNDAPNNDAPNNTPNNDVNNDAPGAMVEEAVSLETSDGKTLAALFWHAEGAQGVPAVLLLHQFGEDKTQWGELPARLVEAGYAALALDLRGHGESDPQNGAPTDIFRDPEQAPRDVQAAMDFLQGSPVVDVTRIGAVGTSVGANLVVVAMGRDLGVRTVVAISPRLEAALALAGGVEALTMTRIFCLAGATDSGGAQAESCRGLVEGATERGEMTIFPDSSIHGVAVLRERPEEIEAMLGWLAETL